MLWWVLLAAALFSTATAIGIVIMVFGANAMASSSGKFQGGGLIIAGVAFAAFWWWVFSLA